MNEKIGVECIGSLIEIKIDHNPHRINPENIFYAMGDYISAYENIGRVLAEAVHADFSFECELESVRKGSIIAKICVKGFDILTNPDGLLKSLIGEISNIDNLSSLARQEEDRLSKKMTGDERYRNRIEPTINKIDLAFAVEKLSKANLYLEPNEKVSLCERDENNNEVSSLDLNTNFRFTGNISKMFSNFKHRHDGADLVDIIKPCNYGNSTWMLKSRSTGHKYSAIIEHSDWLAKYQDEVFIVGAKASLKIHVVYDVFVVDGKEKIKNARIKKVLEIIDTIGVQNELL
ncbi:hypothetical protein [Aliivibrio logei]|uniref:hypothetical protein n=1 Tax=Aliivibrio logei TaxID=688 RepID=UPI0003A55C9E|nr:hypothetical protein [Aliivibrio logei]